MHAWVVRFRQQAVVVPRDTKAAVAVADWFEDAVAAKVEKAKAFDRLQVLRRHAHAVDEHAGCSSKVLWTFEARITGRLFAGPRAQSHAFDHRIEVASLNGSVADYDLSGVGAERAFHCGSNHR